jgi:hypothetical protein
VGGEKGTEERGVGGGGGGGVEDGLLFVEGK